MTAGTFERQAELLETIHACARELQELAGDALVITIAPAKTQAAKPSQNGTRPKPQAAGSPNVKRVRTALGDGQWHGAAAIAESLGVSRLTVTRAMRSLLDSGEVEDNGKARAGRAYRIVEIDEHAAELDDRPDEAPPGSGEREPVAAASNGHTLSPRVRKSIERAQLEAVGEPQEPPEIHARIVRSLREDAGTVTELTMRLDIPRRDVAAAIEQLLASDSISKCGVRPPRNHTVYGATDE